jgi:hypothetical protein
LPSRLQLYKLYVFIEQFNQPVTALGIAAHQPMLVSLDEWAASLAATIEIIQFPCETPGGGHLDFRKIGLAPAPKTWPKTDFETKLLIDFMFFEGKRNMVQSHQPSARAIMGAGSRVISPSTAHPKTPIPGAWRAANPEVISARSQMSSGWPSRHNACPHARMSAVI